jgi:hypothetical protein
MPLHSNSKVGVIVLCVGQRAGGNLVESGGHIAMSPLLREGDFLFSPLFSRLVPTMQGDALIGELLLLEYNDKPTPPVLPAASKVTP